MVTQCTRKNMFDLLKTFGSLLAFSLRMSAYVIGAFHGLSLSNSLIKKLYSVERDTSDEEDEEGTDLRSPE